MAVTIFTVGTGDNPNSGRIKVNSSLTNLKTDVDANTLARTGIGSVVGTTASQILTNKTIVSTNAAGTNVITINREDITGNFLKFTTDSGNKTIAVDGASITNVSILGGNGIATNVAAGVLYVKHPTDTVLNVANQTFTLGSAAHVANYVLDITGNSTFYGKMAIGDWSSVSADVFHIKGTDNATPVGAAIQNTGTAGSILKFIQSATTSYFYMFNDESGSGELRIGYYSGAAYKDAIRIAADVTDETMYFKTGKKVGIDNSNPAYSLEIGSGGLGLESDRIVFDTATVSQLQHVGSGRVKFTTSAGDIMDINASFRSVGIKQAANNTYALGVDGAIYATGSFVSDGSIVMTGAAYFNGGVNCDGGKFLVANGTGNISTQGTLRVTSTSSLIGNVSLSGDVAMVSGKTLTVETLQAVDSTGLIIKNDGGTAVAYFNDSGQLHVGAEEAGVDQIFVVKGGTRLIGTSTTNYFQLTGDGSGNYLDTAGGASAENLEVRVAGTGGDNRSFEVKTGNSSDPASLTTNLLVTDNKFSINSFDTGKAPAVANFYSDTATQRPMHMQLGGSTSLTWNSYYSTPNWKYSVDNYNAASINLDVNYLRIRIATEGLADANLTWTTGFMMDESGRIGLAGAYPNASYGCQVAGALYASSIATTNVDATDVAVDSITVRDEVNTSIVTAGGITTNRRVVINSSDNAGALRIVKSSESYPSSKIALVTGGTVAATIQATEETEDDTQKRVEIGGASSAYLYANEIKAGTQAFAGLASQEANVQVDAKWAPMSYTVYANGNIGKNIVSEAWEESSIRIPKTGLYKITWEVVSYTNVTGDPQHIWVKGKVGTTVIGEHRIYLDVVDPTNPLKRTRWYTSHVGFKQLSANANTSLSIYVHQQSNWGKYTVVAAQLEFICAGNSFNLV